MTRSPKSIYSRITERDLFTTAIYLAIALLIILTNLVWFLPVSKSLRENVTALQQETLEKAKLTISHYLDHELLHAIELGVANLPNKTNLADTNNRIAIQNIVEHEAVDNVQHKEETEILSATLVAQDGTVIFKYQGREEITAQQTNIAENQNFKTAQVTKKLVFGTTQTFGGDTAILPITIPIVEKGAFQGALTIEANTAPITKLIAQITVGGEGKTYLVTEHGIRLGKEVKDLSERDIVAFLITQKKAAVANDDTFSYEDENGTAMLAVGDFLTPPGWGIITEQPKRIALHTIRQVQFFGLIIIFMGLFMVVVLKKIHNNLSHARSTLRSERDRLKAIIASVGEGLILLDEKQEIIHINPLAEKLLHVQDDQVFGKKIYDIITLKQNGKTMSFQDNPITKTIEEKKAASITLTDNISFQPKIGREFPITMVITPIRGVAGINSVIVFRDISEEKRFDEAKSSFLSVASHQLRTPLTNIRWYSEMMLAGDAGELNKDQREYLDQIHKSIVRSAETINALLTLARLEVNRLRNEPKEIRIISFVNDLLKEMKPSFSEKNIAVQFMHPQQIPSVTVDPDILREVILNLISNSIRYAPEKSGKITVRIEFPGDEIWIAIKDNGIGIPKEQQAKIFDRFFRADNARLTVPDGSGLGLHLAQSFVKLWHGKIWFESQEEKGATFFFSIPLNQPTPPKPQTDAKPLPK